MGRPANGCIIHEDQRRRSKLRLQSVGCTKSSRVILSSGRNRVPFLDGRPNEPPALLDRQIRLLFNSADSLSKGIVLDRLLDPG